MDARFEGDKLKPIQRELVPCFAMRRVSPLVPTRRRWGSTNVSTSLKNFVAGQHVLLFIDKNAARDSRDADFLVSTPHPTIPMMLVMLCV